MKKNTGNAIEFVDCSKKVNEDLYPVPAKQEIPNWYKKTPTYVDSKYPGLENQSQHQTNSTVKKCMPFFDSMTAGYVIKSTADVIVSWKGDQPFYQWKTEEYINFQGISQMPQYPGQEQRKFDYPKFKTPWSIRTPKGYSCFITTPIHRDLPFHTLEGIVDTDSFFAPVLFPFYIKEKGWEGIIEAGTPIAQIIPFKREPWSIKVSQDDKKISQAQVSKERITASFLNAYKKSFWQRKQWS